MAEQKESVIVDFKVDEAEAIRSLENYKKSIIDLKEQQKDLNKAYKDGSKSLDQYAKESVQLEASLKKQQAEYNKVQRAVTGLQNPFDKLNSTIKENASQVNVAGISLATFATPATAAIGLLGSLWGAYKNSTIGAKDLEFASNQLSIATNMLSNSFAGLISSTKDGEGFFSKLTSGLLMNADLNIGIIARLGAANKEAAEDLARDEINIRAEINERLEQNQELLSKIQDSQTSYNEKVHLSGEMVTNLRKNEEELVAVKEKQLKLLEAALVLDPENEDLQTAILEKNKEISRVKSDTERKIQGIIRMESNLSDAEDKRLEKLQEQNAAIEEERKAQLHRINENDLEEIDATNEIKLQKVDIFSKDWLEKQEDAIKKSMAAKNKEFKEWEKNEYMKTKIAKLEQQARLDAISNTLELGQNLFAKDSAAYKIMGIGRATIDTYRAADLALATYPPPFGAIAAALAIATGLANVAQIAQVGFSSGGFTGHGGKYQPAGLVHKGEVVWNQDDVRAVGGPHVANSLRPTFGGYADGGIVANAIDLKNQVVGTRGNPEVYLSYKEFEEFWSGVKFKERIITA